MKLKDLILKMYEDEQLRVKIPYDLEWIECTPDTLINVFDYQGLIEKEVSHIWYGTSTKTINIELE